MLHVVLWVESYVIIMLQYETGMIYILCDNPRYVVLCVFHVTAVGAACAAIPFCHEVSTGFVCFCFCFLFIIIYIEVNIMASSKALSNHV